MPQPSVWVGSVRRTPPLSPRLWRGVIELAFLSQYVTARAPWSSRRWSVCSSTCRLPQHPRAWWGADASAPQGLGGLTNELAAFPSMHAGWALWVAVVFIRAGLPRVVQGLGLVYTLVMTIDIVGTGNHWLVDAFAGWAIVLVAFGVVSIWERRSPVVAHEDRALRGEARAR